VRLPRRIGRYEFLELLGRGGAGLVFAGREIGELGVTHDVAIKVLRDFHPELGGQAAFEDEARLLSRIDHPNVVRVRDLTVLRDDELGEMFAIVMPRVRGEDLSVLLRRVRDEGRILPLEATLHLLSQAADALSHVHHACDEAGQPLHIVHRDIKPSNLMVTPEGDLQVLDFGIAWAAERSVEVTQGVVKGTLRYLSPEQMHGTAPDGRADIYALGAVAWEAITGSRYVRTDEGRRGTAAVLGALLKTNLPDRLPELRAALSRDHGLDPGAAEHVADMMLRMLQADRDRRFPHARALAATLERLADRHPLRRGRRFLAQLVAGGSAAEGVVDLAAPRGRDRAERGSDESSTVARGEVARSPGFAVGLALGVAVTALVALALFYGGVLAPPAAQPAHAVELEVAVLPPADQAPELPDDRRPLPPQPGPAHEPIAWLAHRGPLTAGRDGALTFLVRVQGEPVACRPELILRGEGDTWTTRRMARAGRDQWQLTLKGWEVRQLPADVDYWIPCRMTDGSELISWRSQSAPGWFEGGGG
jgi:hypothetical protein